MAKPLSILLVTGEAYPFIKTSELADLCYAHAMGVRDVGHDIRVMMPKYGFISERKNRIHDINRLRDIPIAVGDESFPFTIKSSSIQNARVKVQAYITTNKNFLDDRKGILYDINTLKEFPDNFERMIFFCRTVMHTCLTLNWFPDVIHCVGWETALLPVYIRTMNPAEFRKTRLVLSVPDFNLQGVFPDSDIKKTHLPKDAQKQLKYKDNANLLRAGIQSADRVTVFTEGYAREFIAAKEYKATWAPLFKSKPLIGFNHGIDTLQWNAKNDAFLKHKLDALSVENKKSLSTSLQSKVGLEVNADVPVLCFLGRFTESSGIADVLDAMKVLLKRNVQFLIGSDLPLTYKKTFTDLQKKNAGKVAFVNPIDEEFMHHAMAGSTMLIRPDHHGSLAGLQQIALAYGTIPVVLAKGGAAFNLKDADGENGNAFLYYDANASSLVKAIEKGLKAFAEKKRWNSILVSALTTDVSAKQSSVAFDELYRNLVKEKI